MKHRIVRALIRTALRLTGWKPCILHCGAPGWEKRFGIVTYRGSEDYALSKIDH